MKKVFEFDNRKFEKGESYPFEEGLWIYHVERLRDIHVSQSGSQVKINAKDLRELLFGMDKQDVYVSTSLLYKILIGKRVLIQGFTPNKTKLREWGLTPSQVNVILPGSFPSEEK